VFQKSNVLSCTFLSARESTNNVIIIATFPYGSLNGFADGSHSFSFPENSTGTGGRPGTDNHARTPLPYVT
jgi:hypothetical protein